MSSKNPQELGKKLKKILSNARPQKYLAKVDSLQPDNFSVSLTFFYPKEFLRNVSLEKVPVARAGVGWMPAVGDEVIVEYIGREYPVVTSIFRQAGWAGIHTGKEYTLGSNQNVLVKDDGSILVQNTKASIEIDSQGAIKVEGVSGSLEIDVAGLISLKNNVSDLKKVMTTIYEMFFKMAPVPFATGASFSNLLTQDLVLLKTEIETLLK